MTKNQQSEELKRILILKWRKENSIAWALSKNQSIEQIYVCPAMEEPPTLKNVFA